MTKHNQELYNLYGEYLQTVDEKFTNKSSSYYLKSGFSEWLGDMYNENWENLAKICGFDSVDELTEQINSFSNNN
jgi:hypothetical protein